VTECIHDLTSCGHCQPGAERPGVRQPREDRRDYFEGRTYTFLDTDRPIYAARSGYCAHYDEQCHGFTYGSATGVAEVSRSEARRRGLFDCELCVTPLLGQAGTDEPVTGGSNEQAQGARNR
jgi:hypothetical protein